MDIADSLNQLLESDELIGEMFYSVFLASCPQVQEHFAQVDMRRQAVILTMSLIVVEQYANNPMPATHTYLEFLGDKHRKLGIPNELYEPWKQTMLRTLSEFHGNDWNPKLADQWDHALQTSIDVLTKPPAS